MPGNQGLPEKEGEGVPGQADGRPGRMTRRAGRRPGRREGAERRYLLAHGEPERCQHLLSPGAVHAAPGGGGERGRGGGARAEGPARQEQGPGREPRWQRQPQRGAGDSKQRRAWKGHEPAALGGAEQTAAEAARAAGPRA